MPRIVFGESYIDLLDEKRSAFVTDDLSIEEYHDLGNFKKHGDKAILSKSQLSDILDCPARFKYFHIDGNKSADKDYFNVGNAIHTLALEPNMFHDRFYVIPEGIRRDKRTDAYKACIEEAAERKMLASKDFESIEAMAIALSSNRKAMAILEGSGHIEQSAIWHDKDSGLNLRCRPDLRRDDGLIVDIKTAQSAEPRKFMRQAFDMHYDVSVSMTCDGIEAATGNRPENYVFLVIEKTAPFIIEAYDSFRPFDPDDMSRMTYADAGRYRFRKALDKFIECRKTGEWHGYSEKINPMEVPRYEIKNMEKGE